MVRNYHLIRSILSEPWLISSEEVSRLGYLVSGLFNKNFAFEPVRKEDMASVRYVQPVKIGPHGLASGVGVVNITGVLSKYDPECAYGMESYGRMIRDFDADDSISAIVLKIDSPGGTVSGTEDLYNIVKGASKPIVAFVSDMATSAAYWIACGCSEVIANNTTARLGSIGVYCEYMDVSGFFEANGIKIHEIAAPQSKDKLREKNEIHAGHYEITRQHLSSIAEKFQATVRANRPNVPDDLLTGLVYDAQDVVGTLIDRIGTFEDAVSSAVGMAQDNQSQNDMAKTNFPLLAAAAGVSALEVADGYISLSVEMAGNIEQALADAASPDPEEGATPPAGGGPAASASPAEWVGVQGNPIAILEAQIAERDARIAALEKAPGDDGANVTPASDENKAAAPCGDFSTAFSEAVKFIND